MGLNSRFGSRTLYLSVSLATAWQPSSQCRSFLQLHPFRLSCQLLLLLLHLRQGFGSIPRLARSFLPGVAFPYLPRDRLTTQLCRHLMLCHLLQLLHCLMSALIYDRQGPWYGFISVPMMLFHGQVMRVWLTKSTERAAGLDFGGFSTEADYLTPSWRLHQSRAISKTKSRGSQPRQYKETP